MVTLENKFMTISQTVRHLTLVYICFLGHHHRLIAGNNLSCKASSTTDLCQYLHPTVDNATCTEPSTQQAVPLADVCSRNLGIIIYKA